MATKLPSGHYRTQVFIGYDSEGKRKYKSFTADTAKKAKETLINRALPAAGNSTSDKK